MEMRDNRVVRVAANKNIYNDEYEDGITTFKE